MVRGRRTSSLWSPARRSRVHAGPGSLWTVPASPPRCPVCPGKWSRPFPSGGQAEPPGSGFLSAPGGSGPSSETQLRFWRIWHWGFYPPTLSLKTRTEKMSTQYYMWSMNCIVFIENMLKFTWTKKPFDFIFPKILDLNFIRNPLYL